MLDDEGWEMLKTFAHVRGLRKSSLRENMNLHNGVRFGRC